MNFVQIWQKVISLVTMATNVDSKFLTIVFLFLSGPDHSVKVSSNSESVRAGALLEFFGGYRELMLNSERYAEDNKVHLQAKNKEMCHHLHMQIRRQFKILFGDKFFKQFLNKFSYNA